MDVLLEREPPNRPVHGALSISDAAGHHKRAIHGQSATLILPPLVGGSISIVCGREPGGDRGGKPQGRPFSKSAAETQKRARPQDSGRALLGCYFF
ncbi:MAG: hypothetical protein E7476_07020 [Ruminococcaceae bacterium]|nr:hypothetical protein [Oscillospiraceae bacterium]